MAVLTAVAFVNPALAVAGYLATVLFYVLPAPRFVVLVQRRRRHVRVSVADMRV